MQRYTADWRPREKSSFGPPRRPARTCVASSNAQNYAAMEIHRKSNIDVLHCGMRYRLQHRWVEPTQKLLPTTRRLWPRSPPWLLVRTPSCWWMTCTQQLMTSAAKTVRGITAISDRCVFLPVLPTHWVRVCFDADKSCSLQRPKNVHFEPAGCAFMGAEVAKSVQNALLHQGADAIRSDPS